MSTRECSPNERAVKERFSAAVPTLVNQPNDLGMYGVLRNSVRCRITAQLSGPPADARIQYPDKATESEPGDDVALLEVSLPGQNGVDLLKIVPERAIETALLLVTTRDRLEDKLRGFRSAQTTPSFNRVRWRN